MATELTPGQARALAAVVAAGGVRKAAAAALGVRPATLCLTLGLVRAKGWDVPAPPRLVKRPKPDPEPEPDPPPPPPVADAARRVLAGTPRDHDAAVVFAWAGFPAVETPAATRAAAERVVAGAP